MIPSMAGGVFSLLPLIMKMVSEAIEAVEEIGGSGTGAAKKKAILDALSAAYDIMAEKGTIKIDKAAFMKLASSMIETMLRLHAAKKARGEF